MAAILLRAVPSASIATTSRRTKGIAATTLRDVPSAVAAATTRQKAAPNMLTMRNPFGAGTRRFRGSWSENA
eukprot:2934540-Pyramimonas_sp.AAC.1